MKRSLLPTLPAVALGTLWALATAHGAEFASYGRAGGAVGADRIQYVVANAKPSSASQLVDYPGIAGGPVGADRIRHIVATAKPSQATQVATYPGIAGGPVGADRIAWLFKRDGAKTNAMVVKTSPKN